MANLQLIYADFLFSPKKELVFTVLYFLSHYRSYFPKQRTSIHCFSGFYADITACLHQEFKKTLELAAHFQRTDLCIDYCGLFLELLSVQS